MRRVREPWWLVAHKVSKFLSWLCLSREVGTTLVQQISLLDWAGLGAELQPS